MVSKYSVCIDILFLLFTSYLALQYVCLWHSVTLFVHQAKANTNPINQQVTFHKMQLKGRQNKSRHATRSQHFSLDRKSVGEISAHSIYDNLDIFSLIYHSFLSHSLWETARYRLKYCLKGPLSPKQPTNQPF